MIRYSIIPVGVIYWKLTYFGWRSLFEIQLSLSIETAVYNIITEKPHEPKKKIGIFLYSRQDKRTFNRLLWKRLMPSPIACNINDDTFNRENFPLRWNSHVKDTNGYFENFKNEGGSKNVRRKLCSYNFFFFFE